MSNLTVERILAQTKPSQQITLVSHIETNKMSEPISIEKLRLLLEQELSNIIVELENPNQEIRFNNLYDFVEWYVTKTEEFSPEQQVALNSLTQVRNLIEAGCNCKRPTREHAAMDYFKTFWINNSQTDMPASVLKVAKANKLTIGDFLVYP